jgi:UDP-N-acetylglucosamine 4,6-dehydratase
MKIMKNTNIMITGGTGSFGHQAVTNLVKQKNVKKIIIYSRDEFKQSEMAKYFSKFKKKLRFFIGDVRDKERLKIAMRNVDIVIHAAALKQVPVLEYNPLEAVKTNIIGAQNVVECSSNSSVKKVIALSTDKASSPVNLYGATKLVSDKIFIAANNMFGTNNIKFSVVRYGNVMGSRGSVIPLFLKQREEKFFTITDSKMTRFNISLQEGVKFVFSCLQIMNGGEIFIPKLASYRIMDLLKGISKKKPKVKIIGIRPGEKIHEEMISSNDQSVYEFKNFFIIMPNKEFISWGIDKFVKRYKGKKCPKTFSYNSLNNKKFLSLSEIKKTLHNANLQ